MKVLWCWMALSLMEGQQPCWCLVKALRSFHPFRNDTISWFLPNLPSILRSLHRHMRQPEVCGQRPYMCFESVDEPV